VLFIALGTRDEGWFPLILFDGKKFFFLFFSFLFFFFVSSDELMNERQMVGTRYREEGFGTGGYSIWR